MKKLLHPECPGCPNYIKPTNGCSRVSAGLKCMFPPVATGLVDFMVRADEIWPEGLKLPNVSSGPAKAIDTQVGGEHYKKLGAYQPWLILKASLTPEEFRGYMKGTALVYLLRDGKKTEGDLEKAQHTLVGFIELAP